jgi:2-polyprenyl-3-methyl-5-hydroxy-6-metoxy-1,4-benzoquinol methylase
VTAQLLSPKAGSASHVANVHEQTTHCVVCGAERAPDAETASVRSNVRAFRQERFAVWRCGQCRSIHASDEVDLAHYYAGYPVHDAQLDWKLNVVYGGMLKRLRKAGLRPEHRILDYGAGKGLLVRYLQSQGYANVAGYDRYAEGYDDPSVLRGPYDCIVSQDLIEHVEDPNALLAELSAMTTPGGIVSIGTPDATALDLKRPEDYVHALHLPSHRHILSKSALEAAGQRAGLEVLQHYDTMYNNTLFPTMNPRFVLHYVRCRDDVFDLVVEPVKLTWKMLTPLTPFFALFGYFFDRHTDIQIVFRRPAALPAEGAA